jgi:hypothetical protein
LGNIEALLPTGALAIAGGEEYNLICLFAIQLQFQLDVNNLAFMLIFIFGFSIGGSSGRRFSNALPSPMLYRWLQVSDDQILTNLTK